MMRFKLLIIVLVVGFVAMVHSSAACASITEGQDAPAFVVTTRENKKFDLADQKGKVVIISYWATWCAPCREELPILEALWRNYHSQGLEIVAVSVDNGSMLPHVAQAAKVFTMPIALQSTVTKNDLSPFDSVPKLFVIGRDGKVKSVREGAMQEPIIERMFDDQIKALLDGKTEAKAEASDKVSEPKPDEKK